jgi:hypothetical protein
MIEGQLKEQNRPVMLSSGGVIVSSMLHCEGMAEGMEDARTELTGSLTVVVMVVVERKLTCCLSKDGEPSVERLNWQ